MKTSRDLEIQIRYKPKVRLDFQLKRNGMTYLVIENSGNGIDYLVSHKKLTLFFDSGPEVAK